MGYPYKELVAPAILLDHPGLTREELISAIDQVHVSKVQKFKPDDPWDAHEEEDPELEDYYPKGLLGLAEVLNLDSVGICAPSTDQYGLPINGFHYYYITRYGQHPNWPHKVEIHVANRPGLLTEYSYQSVDRIKVGQVIPGESKGDRVVKPNIFVTEVLDEEEIQPATPYDYKYACWILGKPFSEVKVTEEYPTREEVYTAWPELRSENQFDWNQSQGYFDVGRLRQTDFRWLQIDGRFYLDPQMFNLIPDGMKQERGVEFFGFTDLVLTAEAIKHKAWKLLSNRGKDLSDIFLKDFPDSRVRYLDAVWDAFTSFNARQRGLNTLDFMRMRLLSPPRSYDESVVMDQVLKRQLPFAGKKYDDHLGWI